MSPTSLTITLAAKPKKMPAVTISNDSRTSYEKQLTSYNPELPEHDEGTTNSRRGHLSRVDGDRGILCTDADTHDKSGNEQSFP